MRVSTLNGGSVRRPTRLAILVLLTLSFLFHGRDARAQYAVEFKFPPPGRLVDIGDRKLHIQCSGKGSPTVVLEAGAGAFSIDWALVQPKLASITRVCSYDRAGYAWSDPAPEDDTVEQTNRDLHLLLKNANEKGPHLLVGASISGIFIRAYQRAYPKEVVGLVFVDSSHKIGMNVHGKNALIWDFTEDELKSAFPLPPSVKKGPAPTREDEPFDRLPPDLQAVRLWLDTRRWEAQDPAKAGPESLLSWRREFLLEFQETATEQVHPLGSLPVIVLSRGRRADDPDRKRQQDGLALLSSNSIHIIATESDHEIHLYQPDLVVQALRRCVAAVRQHIPLSRVPEK
jgi:pimeloyl-ACP methyl ester carboxylesterase